MKPLYHTLIILSMVCSGLSAGIEIVILSVNVGTEIDEHENRFYRIFPEDKGLVDAQVIRLDEGNYRIDIVKNIKGKMTKVRRYIDQDELDILISHIDSQPVLTDALMTAMYEGMDFLRAEKIINEIPKPILISAISKTS